MNLTNEHREQLEQLCRDPRRFPILEHRAGHIQSVPWWLVEGHEQQALLNHDQTLETLASRGGLSSQELYCIVHDRKWSEHVPTEEYCDIWICGITDLRVALVETIYRMLGVQSV